LHYHLINAKLAGKKIMQGHSADQKVKASMIFLLFAAGMISGMISGMTSGMNG
jgi:hypothetical protein